MGNASSGFRYCGLKSSSESGAEAPSASAVLPGGGVVLTWRSNGEALRRDGTRWGVVSEGGVWMGDERGVRGEGGDSVRCARVVPDDAQGLSAQLLTAFEGEAKGWAGPPGTEKKRGRRGKKGLVA